MKICSLMVFNCHLVGREWPNRFPWVPFPKLPFPVSSDLASLHSPSQSLVLLPFDDLKISGKLLLCTD